MTGYLRGNLTDEDATDDFLRTAEEPAIASTVLGSPRLNIHGTGLDRTGSPVLPVPVVTDDMWSRATRTTNSPKWTLTSVYVWLMPCLPQLEQVCCLLRAPR